MPTNPIGRFASTSHIYGADMRFFRISDLPATQQAPAALISAVGTPTTSADTAFGDRSLEIHAIFSDGVTSCDILIYRVDPGPTPVLLRTVVGANYATGPVFIGGFEGVTFNGMPVRVTVNNFAGGGTVSVKVLSTS